MRIAYVEALLRAGRDVLLSDIDAFWVRNSLPYLQHVAEATRADITASRDGGGRPLASAIDGRLGGEPVPWVHLFPFDAPPGQRLAIAYQSDARGHDRLQPQPGERGYPEAE